MSIKVEIEWFSVNEKLPVIPKGKHAVSVLAIEHDAVYEEISPGHGSSINNVMWMDGELEEPWFHTMLLSLSPKRKGSRISSWAPCFEEVTHWAYYPEPIQKGEDK